MEDSSIFVPKYYDDETESEFGTQWTGLLIFTKDNTLNFYERIYNYEESKESKESEESKEPSAEFINHWDMTILEQHDLTIHDFQAIAYEERVISLNL